MKLHHTAISVRDLETTIKFYVQNFGFERLKNFERPDLGAKVVFLGLNGNYIEVWQFEKQASNKDDFFNLNTIGYKHIGLRVENVEEVYEKLRSRGLEVTAPKQGAIAKYIFVKDPDGFPVEVLQIEEPK